jgi:hypothetical protein
MCSCSTTNDNYTTKTPNTWIHKSGLVCANMSMFFGVREPDGPRFKNCRLIQGSLTHNHGIGVCLNVSWTSAQLRAMCCRYRANHPESQEQACPNPPGCCLISGQAWQLQRMMRTETLCDDMHAMSQFGFTLSYASPKT